MALSEIEVLEQQQRSSDIHKVGLSIEDAKSHINLKQAFERLCKNTDFKLIIEKEYLKLEPVRLVLLKTDPQFADEAGQKQLDIQMFAIAGLRQHFSFIMAQGTAASNALAADEAVQAELLAEDL